MKTFISVTAAACFAAVAAGHADGQVIQGQVIQGQVVQGQVIQGQGIQYPAGTVFPNGGTPVYPAGQNGIQLAPPATIHGVPSTTVGSVSGKKPWYQSLTNDREHNFGVVARASKQEHVFEFENNTGADLFLTGIRTSCGCTKPRILTPHVKSGQTAKINAAFDTLKFFGKRGATLTVSMQKNGRYTEYAEIQFAVRGQIRRDVVVAPGEVNFQDINLSESKQQVAKVLYAGNPNWQILEVKSTNPNVSAKTKQLERNPATGRVSYEMLVSINGSQAAGQFNDTLTIVTNDPNTNGMPVKVGGNVKKLINVAPIALGIVNKNQEITKKLIVRSPNAISIDKIETKNPKIKFQPSSGKKTLHILTYTLDTSEPGDIDSEITIFSNDDQPRKTKVAFSVQIVNATVTSDNDAIAQSPNK